MRFFSRIKLKVNILSTFLYREKGGNVDNVDSVDKLFFSWNIRRRFLMKKKL